MINNVTKSFNRYEEPLKRWTELECKAKLKEALVLNPTFEE